MQHKGLYPCFHFSSSDSHTYTTYKDKVSTILLKDNYIHRSIYFIFLNGTTRLLLWKLALYDNRLLFGANQNIALNLSCSTSHTYVYRKALQLKQLHLKCHLYTSFNVTLLLKKLINSI